MADMELEPESGQPAADPVGPPETPKVVINLDDADDDASEAQAETAPDKKTRRQQARDYRRQLDEQRRQVDDLRTQIARLEGRVSVPGPAAASQNVGGMDPLQGEIDSLETQQQAIVAAIQAPGQAQAHVEKLVETWRKMESHRRKLEYRQFRQAERADEPPDAAENKFIGSAMAAEFPAIMRSDAMKLRARAEATEIMEQRRVPWSMEVAREACQRVAAKHGIGQRPPAPTDIERSRLSGIPARAGASGGGSNGQYTPSAFELSLARGFTKHLPDLTDEDRWVKWAKATGNYKRQAG